MSKYFYPTASTTAVFINGYHIDQAYRIDYRESAPKIPIYGYNDYNYSTVARGRTLINGIMVINFVFPGYLQPAVLQLKNRIPFVPSLYNYDISKHNKETTDHYKDDLYTELRTELPQNNTEADTQARAQYIASLLAGKSREDVKNVKETLHDFFTTAQDPQSHSNRKTGGDIRRSIYSSVIDPTPSIDKTEGSTVDIYYYSPERSLWFVRFLDVYFSDTSQQISQAGAEGSSEPLYEVYNFIASKKQIITLDRNRK